MSERIEEVKEMLAKAIPRFSPHTIYVSAEQYRDDVYYEGPIGPLLEFFQEYRSEIEELGNGDA